MFNLRLSPRGQIVTNQGHLYFGSLSMSQGHSERSLLVGCFKENNEINQNQDRKLTESRTGQNLKQKFTYNLPDSLFQGGH